MHEVLIGVRVVCPADALVGEIPQRLGDGRGRQVPAVCLDGRTDQFQRQQQNNFYPGNDGSMGGFYYLGAGTSSGSTLNAAGMTANGTSWILPLASTATYISLLALRPASRGAAVRRPTHVAERNASQPRARADTACDERRRLAGPCARVMRARAASTPQAPASSSRLNARCVGSCTGYP